MLDLITINEHSSIRINEGKVIYSDPYRELPYSAGAALTHRAVSLERKRI